MTPDVPTDRAALLLVDVQNAFLHPDGMVARLAGGALASTYTDTIGPLARTIAAASEAEVPVIYTQHAWRPDFRDAGFLGTEMLQKLHPGPEAEREVRTLTTGSWEAEILPELAPRPEDWTVPKNRYDAFLGTSLEQLLQRLGVETLVVAGLVTTVCVESTVRSASMRDHRVFVVADAVGDAPEVHESGLERLGTMFAHVVTTEEVAGAWAAAVPAAA